MLLKNLHHCFQMIFSYNNLIYTKKIIIVKNYINYLNELVHSSLNYNELLELANVTDKTTGIEDVVIWIGPNPPNHGKRIKISNQPNKFDGKDCFTLTIPDFKIIGNINDKFIDTDKLNKIKEFIEINIDIITKYSDYLLSTEDLLSGLKKVLS
jgi:hypothetical protein